MPGIGHGPLPKHITAPPPRTPSPAPSAPAAKTPSPAASAPAAKAAPASPGAGPGRPALSGPMDPRKLPPGPNQLAGVLDHAPAKLKAEMLHLQNRPEAFYQDAKPARMIHGKPVAISAPLMGMKLPGGSAKTEGTLVPAGPKPASPLPAGKTPQQIPAPPQRLAIEAPPAKEARPLQDLTSLSGSPIKEKPSLQDLSTLSGPPLKEKPPLQDLSSLSGPPLKPKPSFQDLSSLSGPPLKEKPSLQDLSSLSGPPLKEKPVQDLSTLSGPPLKPKPAPTPAATPPGPAKPASSLPSTPPPGAGAQGGTPGKLPAGPPITQNVQFIQYNLHYHAAPGDADPFRQAAAGPKPQGGSAKPAELPSQGGKPDAMPHAKPAEAAADTAEAAGSASKKMGMGAKIAAGLAALGVAAPLIAVLGAKTSPSDTSAGTPGNGM